MHEFPPASVHVRRHLTPRELGTIAVALELLADIDAPVTIESARRGADYFEELLNDAQIAALRLELASARKVKVCRSKQKPA